MSGYPKATCQHSCPQAASANERAERWEARHDAASLRAEAMEDRARKLLVAIDTFARAIELVAGRAT